MNPNTNQISWTIRSDIYPHPLVSTCPAATDSKVYSEDHRKLTRREGLLDASDACPSETLEAHFVGASPRGKWGQLFG